MTVNKPEFLKATSGLEEFLALESQLGVTTQEAELVSSSLIKSIGFASLHNASKAGSPRLKQSNGLAHMKHHYPVTPLIFSKGPFDVASQLKHDLNGSILKQSFVTKSTNRRLESATDKKRALIFDSSDCKRQASSQNKDSSKQNSEKKPIMPNVALVQRASQKEAIRPNSSAVSFHQDRLSLFELSSKKERSKPSNDMSGQLVKTDADRSSAQKSKKAGVSHPLNVSQGSSIDKEISQATRHKLQGKVRQYYQQQLTKVDLDLTR